MLYLHSAVNCSQTHKHTYLHSMYDILHIHHTTYIPSHSIPSTPHRCSFTFLIVFFIFFKPQDISSTTQFLFFISFISIFSLSFISFISLPFHSRSIQVYIPNGFYQFTFAFVNYPFCHFPVTALLSLSSGLTDRLSTCTHHCDSFSFPEQTPLCSLLSRETI